MFELPLFSILRIPFQSGILWLLLFELYLFTLLSLTFKHELQTVVDGLGHGSVEIKSDVDHTVETHSKINVFFISTVCFISTLYVQKSV